MKVKLLIPRCGPGIADNIGDVVEVTADEAKRMIEAGQARPVKTTERAVKKGAVETADK